MTDCEHAISGIDYTLLSLLPYQISGIAAANHMQRAPRLLSAAAQLAK